MGLQDEYNTYRSNYWYYQNKKEKLDDASKKIDAVIDTYEKGETKLKGSLKGIKWKGKQEKDFEKVLDELNNNVKTSKKKITTIQDAIDKEAKNANKNKKYYKVLADDTWKQLQASTEE